MKISFQNLFYVLSSIILLIIGLHYANPVMIPMASALLLSLAAIVVYTFLLLIYRSGIMKVFVDSVKKDFKPKVREMIVEMQKVGQNYLVGMGIMILILGSANSTLYCYYLILITPSCLDFLPVC